MSHRLRFERRVTFTRSPVSKVFSSCVVMGAVWNMTVGVLAGGKTMEGAVNYPERGPKARESAAPFHEVP